MIVLRHQSGFTLLEMIVAMALSALVSMIGAMALGAGADFYARSGLRQHSHADMRAAERTLRTEWESRGSSVVLTPDGVEFDTTTPVTSMPLPGAARIRYQCQPDQKGRFTLTSQTLPAVGEFGRPTSAGAARVRANAGPDGGAQESPVVAGLTECGFAALQNRTDNAGRVTSAWVESWSSKERSPQLLRVKLVGELGDMPSMVFVARRK